METPFKLVPDSISHDTIKATRTLANEAENGDLIGFAFTAMYRKGDYIVNAAGEAYKSPTFAIGMVVILLYKLVKRAISKQGR
jgi:peptide subunit release factor RF-3